MVNKKKNRWLSFLCFSFAVCLLLGGTANPSKAETGDEEFSKVRDRWIHSLTGGTEYDPADPEIAARIDRITQKAQSVWDLMDKSPDRTYLFSDFKGPVPTQNITESYVHLKEMALAHSTAGSPLYKNEALRADILEGLDWLNEHWYYTGMEKKPQSPSNNWFVWELGVPLNLTDVLGLMHEYVSQEQIDNNLKAIDYFLPNPSRLGTSVGWNLPATGANLAWASTAVGKRGILGKNSAKIQLATSSLSPLFKYADNGSDGFYKDGSVLFHGGFPYTTGYGWSNLIEPAKAISLYEGSPWAITDKEKENLISWVLDSYEPLIYKNRIFDNLDGREITRQSNSDKADPLLPAILNLLPAASEEQAVHLRSLVKYLITTDPTFDYYSRAALPEIVELKKIVSDTGTAVRKPLDLYKQFPYMDRNVMQRKDFMFGVSMHSSRTGNYETINFENLIGWHTADGRTTLYNNDLTQFSDGYWPTVDASRLPGTTIQNHRKEDVISPQIGKVTLKGDTEQSDSLDDLSGIFYRSPMWNVTGDESDFYGDSSRLSRTQNSYEYIIYKANQLKDFELDMFFSSYSNLDRLEVFTSSDNNSYVRIDTVHEPTEMGNEWFKAKVKPAKALPANTNYLKIQLIPSVTSGLGTQDFAGGTDIDGKYGVSGMRLQAHGQSLMAKKSWFMFDNEIASIGSDIHSNDNRTVETIAENRKLTDSDSQKLTLDGKIRTLEKPWESTNKPVRWAHLSGAAEKSDTGYYFPSKPKIHVKNETRTGSWSQITGGGSTTQVTRYYLSLGIPQGLNPEDEHYSYVLLPSASSKETAKYAKKPQIEILSETNQIHAVKEKKLNVIGANFWEDKESTLKIKGKPFLTSDRKASVMTKETKKGISLSLTDPTWKNKKGGLLIDDAQSFNNIHSRTDDWMLETGGGFKRRLSTSTQHLVYKLNDIQEFEATLRYNFTSTNNRDLLDRVKFYVSGDNQTFTEIPVRFKEPHEPISAGGLGNQTVVVPDQVIPEGSHYLKVEFVGGADKEVWSPQLRHMKITGKQTDDGYIHIDLNRKAKSIDYKDPRIEVLQLSPTIRLKVDVDSLEGLSVKANFTY
ncbi:polysaccharide lyase 8 family protein [Metabacillus indicus]|uniref:polysaccharide lyase 8 family protein n=1 Tax=Metabacillus indicus TaxID=246786 RepID=UPI003983E304